MKVSFSIMHMSSITEGSNRKDITLKREFNSLTKYLQILKAVSLMIAIA